VSVFVAIRLGAVEFYLVGELFAYGSLWLIAVRPLFGALADMSARRLVPTGISRRWSIRFAAIKAGVC
jgi:hypothetical protein